MKKILLLALVALLAVAAWFIATLDSRIEASLEKTATTLAGVPVTIDSLELSLSGGSGSITGLKVANPPGYEGVNAFVMDSVTFDVDIGSVFSQPLVINSLIFNAPVINLEVKDDLNSNLQDIVRVSTQQVQGGEPESTGSGEPGSGEAGTGEEAPSGDTAPAGSESSDDEFRIAFRRLEVNGAQLNAKRGGDEWTDTLPDIGLDNFGGAKGLTTRELGISLVRRLTTASLEQAATRKLTDYVEDKVKDLSEKLLESLNKD